MNPFAAHAAAVAQTQKIFGGGDRLKGALLNLFGADIPCTHTQVLQDFEVMPGGQSFTTVVQELEFLASDVAAAVAAGKRPIKGENCRLTVTLDGQAYDLKLWTGGLLPGGQVYRFMAVDQNYRG